MMQSSPNGSSSEESSLNITIIFLPADFASSIYGVASECPYLNGNRTKSQSSIEVSLICCFASANKSFSIGFLLSGVSSLFKYFSCCWSVRNGTIAGNSPVAHNQSSLKFLKLI